MCPAVCQASGSVWVPVGYGRTRTVEPAGIQRWVLVKNGGTPGAVTVLYGRGSSGTTHAAASARPRRNAIVQPVASSQSSPMASRPAAASPTTSANRSGSAEPNTGTCSRVPEGEQREDQAGAQQHPGVPVGDSGHADHDGGEQQRDAEVGHVLRWPAAVAGRERGTAPRRQPEHVRRLVETTQVGLVERQRERGAVLVQWRPELKPQRPRADRQEHAQRDTK